MQYRKPVTFYINHAFVSYTYIYIYIFLAKIIGHHSININYFIRVFSSRVVSVFMLITFNSTIVLL